MPVPKGTRIGGRQKGTPNKRTVEQVAKTQQVAAAVEQVLGTAFEGDAHAYLMSVYKDPTATRAERIDAAGKAIKFEKPALAALDVKADNTVTVYDVSDRPQDEAEWAANVHGAHH